MEEFTLKQGKKMKVTMEDGFIIVFFYDFIDIWDDEGDKTWWFSYCSGSFNFNRVDASTVRVVIGEPLSFDYYYGYGSRDTVKTETNVQNVEYLDDGD